MPFAALDQPPLGVSLLKACLGREGIECSVAHLHLAFADLVGADLYERVLRMPFTSLAGEWVFARALYSKATRLPDGYVDDVLRGTWQLGGEDVDTLAFVRSRVEAFLRQAEDAIPWGEFEVIGFTSFFAQNLAALNLARRIKERHPEVVIVFGGYNWHGVMGEQQLRSFPFVDVACVGEGDVALPAFVKRLATGDPSVADCGLVLRGRGGAPASAVPPLSHLDDLPLPDYADYFEAVRGSRREQSPVVLSAETSRGCWWAARHPCRFCGLTGTLREYRTKSRERILTELRQLAQVPECTLVELVDNVVSPIFLREVLPELAADPLPARIFFEMRPEVTREDVRNIARAGAMVQVGIESLSDEVLVAMGKGSSALANIRLLRWCAEEDVRPTWNVICSIPGETDAAYASMLRLLPRLWHLSAPSVCTRMSLDRFSPFFEEPERYGITGVRPLAPYRHIYPFDEEAVMNIASAFEYELGGASNADDRPWRLKQSVHAWRRERRPGALLVDASPSGNARIIDDRSGHRREIDLDPLGSLLYLACEDIRTKAELVAFARKDGASDADVERRIQELVADGLMAETDAGYLSLALFGRLPAALA